MLCMDCTPLPALVSGRSKRVWEEREADAHDHKGPARTKTLALFRYGDRGVYRYPWAVIYV